MMVSLVCARTALANLLSASSPAGGWGWGCGCRRVSLPVSPDGAARRHGSSSMSSHQTEAPSPPSFHFHPELATDWKKKFLASFTVLENFVSEEEEAALIKEADPHLKRMVYEKDHWDEAIVGFREIERRHWNSHNSGVIRRIQERSFLSEHKLLPYVHVLDLAPDGHIKPHVDSARFCGDVVAVVSLLSQAVARFAVEKDKSHRLDLLLPRRSLYIMCGSSRYDFTHEILANGDGSAGFKAERERRVSVICRCQPDAQRAAKS